MEKIILLIITIVCMFYTFFGERENRDGSLQWKWILSIVLWMGGIIYALYLNR